MTITPQMSTPHVAGSAVALPPAIADQVTVSTVVATYATDLQHCAGFAEAIVDTPFVPAALWPAPAISSGDNVTVLKAREWDFRRQHPREDDQAFGWRRRNAIATTAAIVYSGAVLGLNWQAALSGLYVANGRTSLYASQIRALILAAGHDFDVVERGEEVATVAVKRRGETKATEFSFTIETAIRAGYVKGKGPNSGSDAWKGNDKYNTDPAAMLFARVTTIAAEAKFADVTRGMTARETFDDEHQAEPIDITASVVHRPSARQAAIQPAAEADTPDPAEPAPAPAPIEKKQWDAINARFAELGVSGPGQLAGRMRIVSTLTGREVAKGSELTAAEGELILDSLAGDAGRRAVAGWKTAPGQPAADEQPTAPAADVDPGDADPDADPDLLPEQPASWSEGGDQS